MAKKRKTTHRRRRRGLSDGLAKKVSRKRRRRSPGLLSSMNTSNLMEAGKEIVGGGFGGYAAGKLYHMSASYSPFQKLLTFGGAAFAANMMGFKNVAAGIAGGYGFAVEQGMPGMSEGEDLEEHEYTDKKALEEMPDGMDEDGEPMYLGEDGDLYYLHELEEGEDLEEDENELSELLADEYPDYINSSNY